MSAADKIRGRRWLEAIRRLRGALAYADRTTWRAELDKGLDELEAMRAPVGFALALLEAADGFTCAAGFKPELTAEIERRWRES